MAALTASQNLTAAQVAVLDVYVFLALIGKKVIHPGGRRSTEELFQRAGFQPQHRVLEVGCGVGTTAIEIARRFGCQITAVDIDSLMLERASTNVQRAQVADKVIVERGDIHALKYADNTFDRVVVEAVTTFVDRAKAAREVVRVCKPGGYVLDHEFIYRQPPTPQVRQTFEGEVCPGARFDSPEDWAQHYRSIGLTDIQHVSGPFAMMQPIQFLRDEGIVNSVRIMARTFSRLAHLKKMSWMMPRMLGVMPYLGYVVLVGKKPTN